VSEHLGHSSVTTTQRYDRARSSLSRTPVHQLAAYTAAEQRGDTDG
jgi:hypothetical protein